MKNLSKNITTKVVAIFITIAICITALLSLWDSNMFVFADNEQTATSNVAYFEGYNENLSAEAIHNLTRIPSYEDDAPSITVFVHGQGGNASHWSNDGNGNFIYDVNSLIEKLRNDAGGANVYWARMAVNDVADNEEDIFNELEDSLNRFFLTKLNLEAYSTDNEHPENQEFVTKITDISKHTIIVFESAVPASYHRDVYEELHTVIDRVSYDFLCLTGRIPKVNLISHSRGGLVSMMYASGYQNNGRIHRVSYPDINNDDILEEDLNIYNGGDIIQDHPFNIGALYSFGTPYIGTELDEPWAHELIGDDPFNSPSAKNVLDEIVQTEIKSNWESAVTKNPNLKLYACAGEISLNFVLGLIVEEREALSSFIVKWKDYINATLYALANQWIPKVEVIASLVLLPLAPTIIVIAEDARMAAIDAYEEPNLEQKLLILDEFLIKYYRLINAIKDCLLESTEAFTGIDSMSDLGDLFIDTPSQLAEGFVNVERFTKVYEYTSLEIIEGENGLEAANVSRNFAIDKLAHNNFAIPHNLETYDLHMHSRVRCNITLGVPSSICNYVEEQDGTAKITGYTLPSYYNNTFNNLQLDLSAGVSGKVVSCVGANAFANFTVLTSITIPNSVTSIGDYAFSGCSSLTSITIPSSVTDIGIYAFNGCSSLTSVNIDADIEEIPYGMFAACSSLQSISFPYGITRIGAHAFRNSGLNGSLTIPSSVTSIGNSAFRGCDELTAISFGANSSLTSIGDDAFSESGLQSFTFPSGVTEVADSLFDGCSSLTSVNLHNDVRTIGDRVFRGTNLSSIRITPNVREIGDWAFYACEQLSSITWTRQADSNQIVSLLHTVGQYAFADSGLESITIPDTVEEIGESAFNGCESLTAINISPTSQLASIGAAAFMGSGIMSIYIPNNVTEIKYNTFEDCIDLQSVVFEPNSNVQGIGYMAFRNSGIEEIIIPESVETIDDYAFMNCQSLTHVRLERAEIGVEQEITQINPSAFVGCNLVSIKVPYKQSINAYKYSLSLYEDIISYDIPSLTYTLLDNGTYMVSKGDIAIEGELIIPDTYNDVPVTAIANNAFSGWDKITSVTIPNSVTVIGSAAFSGCSSVMSVTIPLNVTTIGDYAFANCVNLATIYLPAAAEINDTVFDGCINLAKIIVPNSVAIYNAYIAQLEDESLIELVEFESSGLSFTLQNDGTYKVSALITSLTGEVVIPAYYNGVPVTRIGNYGFEDCIGITSIRIPSTVTAIGAYAFSGCSNLNNVVVPESVASIGACAFSDCEGLYAMILMRTLDRGITLINPTAFSGCELGGIRVMDEESYNAYFAYYETRSEQIAEVLIYIMYL